MHASPGPFASASPGSIDDAWSTATCGSEQHPRRRQGHEREQQKLAARSATLSLDAELKARGAELAFAEMKDPVKDRLSRYGLVTQLGDAYFFPTLGVAVKAFLERNQVEWQDWDEEEAPQK